MAEEFGSTVADVGIRWLNGLPLEYQRLALGVWEIGGAATTAVCGDVADADPPAFVAVTATRSVEPTSDVVA
ncbi:MAG TPA: hypothetical protein VFM13_05120 [Gaiellaceae bacterium]|nr:hypothetical protein [Gaiellaceae bacterium]